MTCALTPGSVTSAGAIGAAGRVGVGVRGRSCAVVPVLVRDADGTLPASGGAAGGWRVWTSPPPMTGATPEPPRPSAAPRPRPGGRPVYPVRDAPLSGGGT